MWSNGQPAPLLSPAACKTDNSHVPWDLEYSLDPLEFEFGLAARSKSNQEAAFGELYRRWWATCIRTSSLISSPPIQGNCSTVPRFSTVVANAGLRGS